MATISDIKAMLKNQLRTPIATQNRDSTRVLETNFSKFDGSNLPRLEGTTPSNLGNYNSTQNQYSTQVKLPRFDSTRVSETNFSRIDGSNQQRGPSANYKKISQPENHVELQGIAEGFHRSSNGTQWSLISTQNHVSTMVSAAGFTRMGGSMEKEVDRVFSQKPSAPSQNLLSAQNSMVDFQVTPYPEHCLNNCITELGHTTQIHTKVSNPTPKNLEANLSDLHDTSKTTVGVRKFPNSSNTPCFSSEPISNKPMVDTNTRVQNQNTKPSFNKTTRIFNASELADREAKGLCMFCDELFTPGHQLKHRRLRILVMEGEEEEPPYKEEKPIDGEELVGCDDTETFLGLDLARKLDGDSSGAEFLGTKSQEQGYIQEQVDTINENGSVESLNRSEITLRQIQELAPEPHRVHLLSCFNCLTRHNYVAVLENLHGYFEYNAGGEGFGFVPLAGGNNFGRNEIALLCLGMMHFDLGYPTLALEALTNAVRVSQQHLFVLLKGSLKRAENSFETPLGSLIFMEIQDHKLLTAVLIRKNDVSMGILYLEFDFSLQSAIGFCLLVPSQHLVCPLVPLFFPSQISF